MFSPASQRIMVPSRFWSTSATPTAGAALDTRSCNSAFLAMLRMQRSCCGRLTMLLVPFQRWPSSRCRTRGRKAPLFGPTTLAGRSRFAIIRHTQAQSGRRSHAPFHRRNSPVRTPSRLRWLQNGCGRGAVVFGLAKPSTRAPDRRWCSSVLLQHPRRPRRAARPRPRRPVRRAARQAARPPVRPRPRRPVRRAARPPVRPRPRRSTRRLRRLRRQRRRQRRRRLRRPRRRPLAIRTCKTSTVNGST
mmetsp:Transcript_94908/g.250776  ORF Transcript_94908/g.250776 Transcript_94908/m.250776 type:complete len:247 (+) Transcript_94908:256-996(+)